MLQLPTLSELIEMITRRPGMFGAHGSFDEAVAFINGYWSAAQAYGGNNDLDHFQKWIADKLAKQEGLPKNLPWSSYVGPGKEDADRFALLRSLSAEYRSETQ